MWFGFQVRLGLDSNCIIVFGVACAKEGTLGVVGYHRSHRIESRTPSHLVQTRCLTFCLSEFCEASLGTLVELDHTGVRRPRRPRRV